MKIKFSKKKDANDAGSTVTVEATAEKKEEQKTDTKKKFFQKKPKLTAEEALKRLDEIQRVSFIKLADNITELNNINTRYNDMSYFRSAVNNVTADRKERKAADELCKVIAEELAFQLRKEYYTTHNDENEYRGWMSDKINLYTRTIAIAMNDADWKDNIEKIIAGFMKNKNLHVFDAMISDIESKEDKRKAEEAVKKVEEEAKKKAEEDTTKKVEEPKASVNKPEEEKESKGFAKFVKKKEEKVAKTMDFSKFVKPKEAKEPINPMPNPNMANMNVVNMSNQKAQPTDEEIINKMKSNSTYNVDMFKANIVNDPKFFKWHKPRTFSTEQIDTLYDMVVSDQLIAQAKQFGAITQPMFIVPGVAPMEAMPTLVEVKLSDYYKFDKKKDSKKKYEYAFELEYPGKDPTHPIIMLVNIKDRTMNIQRVHKHD